MDALNFAFWLRGYTEITNGAHPDATQWQIIQDHLNEVFVKVTPDRQPAQKDPTLPPPRDDITYCGGRARSVYEPLTGDAPQSYLSVTC